MMRSLVLIAFLLATTSQAAVLVRFINTVPALLDVQAYNTLVGLSSSGRLIGDQVTVDRIGLQYFAQSSTGTTQSPTLVWTENTNMRSNDVISGTAPYAYLHAMPPLRQYHMVSDKTVPWTDRVAAYLSTQIDPSVYSTTIDPSANDNYEQTTLKADGVGLYLTFAAGTYQMQAYAVKGATTAFASLPIQLANTQQTMTFVDGNVYTIIATGNGAFSASTPTTSNTVALSVIQESTAPATFGKATLRWFHAINSKSSSPITVYLGDTAAADALAQSIAFGTASNYVDVAPKTSQVFPVTITNSDGSTSVIAPSSASRLEATADVRAGLRATVICAAADSATGTIFCRMIPSRVVAYVRLINDLQGQNALVQGPFGSVPLANSLLTLWGSYEFPRPDQVTELSQTVGGSNPIPASPALGHGLYGVVSGVSSGTCSGYGEVWVPLLIMDRATRFTVIRDDLEFTFGGAGASYTSAGGSNQQDPTTDISWFWAATIFKRVNFVLKTDGFATLTGIQGTPATNPVRDVANSNLNQYWYINSLLLDEYMEPGQYYSLVVTPDISLDQSAGVQVNPYVPSSLQIPNIASFYWRLDRTVDLVSGGVGSGKGIVNWIPIGTNQNLVGTINFRQVGSSNVNLQPTISSGTGVYTVAASIAGAGFVWNTPTPAVTANAGSYSFDHTATAPAPQNACYNKFPGSTAVTVNDQDVIDVFLLNSFGCYIGTSNTNALNINVCKTQSALVTGHAVNTLLAGPSAAPSPSSTFFVASASTTSSSAALLLAAILAILATLL